MFNELANALTQDIQTVETNSSENTNAVNTLRIASGDLRVQALIEKVNVLIPAARRRGGPN